MKKNTKRAFYAIPICLLIIGMFVIFVPKKNQPLGDTIQSLSPFQVISNVITTRLNTWSLQIPQLGGSGTKCLHTDNSGNISRTAADCGAGGGGLTSVGLIPPTGFTVSNSPLVADGSISLAFAAGYSLPLTASISNHDTFYHTPSTRISAGTNLSWSGNTLNASGGGSSFNGLLMHEGTTAGTHITDLTYNAGGFNFSPTASAGTLSIDYTNGPASRSMANTWSQLQTFTLGASSSGNFTPTADNTYSLGNPSLRWQTGYFGTSLGINSGSTLNTTLEVGGTASISGNTTIGGTLTTDGNLNTKAINTNGNAITIGGTTVANGYYNWTNGPGNLFQVSGNLIYNNSPNYIWLTGGTVQNDSLSAGTYGIWQFNQTFGPRTSSTLTSNFRLIGINIAPTFGTGSAYTYNATNPMTGLAVQPTININTSSTGSYAALLVNPTETSVGSGVTNYLAKFQNGGIDKMVITSSGNVGIGTTAPLTKFNVKGGTASMSAEVITGVLNAGLGGVATVSYNRFGTGTTGQSLSTTNDLLISGRLEVLGSSHSFTGSIEGPSDNTLDIGTVVKAIKQLFAYTVKAITNLIIPSVATPSLSANNNLSIGTASKSLEFYDGATQSILLAQKCFTFYVESPNSTNPKWIGHKVFTDPFVIDEVRVVASGTFAAGWNLKYGTAGTLATAVFGANKSASGSASTKYTSFANATIGDGNVMDVLVSSTSQNLQSFAPTICGHNTH